MPLASSVRVLWSWRCPMSLMSRCCLMIALFLLPAALVGCSGGPPVAKSVVRTELAGERYKTARDRIRVWLVGLPSTEADRIRTLETLDVDKWISGSHPSFEELKTKTIYDEARVFSIGTASSFDYTDQELMARFGPNLDAVTLIVFADIPDVKQNQNHDPRRAKVLFSRVEWKKGPVVVKIASDGVSIGTGK